MYGMYTFVNEEYIYLLVVIYIALSLYPFATKALICETIYKNHHFKYYISYNICIYTYIV